MLTWRADIPPPDGYTAVAVASTAGRRQRVGAPRDAKREPLRLFNPHPRRFYRRANP
jgi:hypothetical protein